jgi:hypothetical protein
MEPAPGWLCGARRWTAVLALACAGASPGAAQTTRVESFLFTPVACQGSPPFSDLTVGHPYCAWIQRAGQDEIATGCGGGRYCPDGPLTRAQAALHLERAMRGTASWDRDRGVFVHTLLVSPVDGDEPASGQRLLDAVALATAAGGSSQRLVLLEPGVYDIGAQPLELDNGIGLAGAGLRSLIKASVNGAAVRGAFSAPIARLRVVNNGGGTSPVGVDTNGSSLTDVSVEALGGSPTAILADAPLVRVGATAIGNGTAIGIDSMAGSIDLEDVSVSASGGGVSYGLRVRHANLRVVGGAIKARTGTAQNYAIYAENAGAELLLRNLTAEAAGDPGGAASETTALKAIAGTVIVERSHLAADNLDENEYGLSCVNATGARVEVHHSRLVGPTATVQADDADCTVRIGHSQLKGGAVVEGAGDVRCVAAWGDGFSSPGINDCF